jgi:predicted molibdopterin-dependent oxidoreductase YjgC
MARVVLGTNNVDNGSYGSGTTIINAINERLDRGGRITPLVGLEQAEMILVIGANPTQSIPVAGYFLKRASKMKGIPLIVADPRKTELVPFSSLWLPLAPHSDSEFINGLAAILYKRGSYDKDFVERFTKGFDLYCDGLSSLQLERVSRITGLDKELLEKAANLIEGKKITFVIGHGILQQRYGNLALEALLNLSLMTGSLGGGGNSLYFLSRENNQMGAWDMGAVPDYLPGHQPIGNDMKRKHWEQVWRIKLSPDPGLNMVRMIEEAEKGNLKALYIMGENPLRSLPQPERIKNALRNLELLVVQDILATETIHLADVVLPAAAFSEKGGAFTNLEGKIQSFEPVIPPPGKAKPDWKILDLLFSKMGSPKEYSSLLEIRGEISHQIPMYAELGRHGKTLWIKETSNRSLFHPDGEGEPIHFSPVIPTEDEVSNGSYPLKAILGTLRYHMGSGTRTGCSVRIKDFALNGDVEISSEDSARLNLKEGDKVRISSLHGSISRAVTLKKDLRPGLIFVPMAFHDNDARELIELTQLGVSDSPGWKECNVKIDLKDEES